MASRHEHRAEAERKLTLAIDQSRHLSEPNSWTVPYLLMAVVHAVLSLEAKHPKTDHSVGD